MLHCTGLWEGVAVELRDLPFVTCGDDAWIACSLASDVRPEVVRPHEDYPGQLKRGQLPLRQAGSKFSKTALHWPLEGCGGGAEGPAICHMWG